MVSEGLEKMDGILSYIITDRYLIGRTSEIIPAFDQLNVIHNRYAGDLEKLISALKGLPDTKSAVEDALAVKKADLIYLRQKSDELAENLEEDDLIPMAPEVVNFLNALQHYLSTISGRFVDSSDHVADLMNGMNATSVAAVQRQAEAAWSELALAYEPLKFLAK